MNYIEFTVLEEYEKALTAFSADWAVPYIMLHPDARSYLVLMRLREKDRRSYDKMPAPVRAKVLCAGLRAAHWYNDWGLIGGEVVYHGDSARALLECGASAVGCLWPLLNDKRPAELSGSEDATHSQQHRLRKCDFAFQFISVLTHRTYKWEEAIADRDRAIDAFIAEYAAAQARTSANRTATQSRTRAPAPSSGKNRHYQPRYPRRRRGRCAGESM